MTGVLTMERTLTHHRGETMVEINGRECKIVKVHVLSTEEEDKVREVHVPTDSIKIGSKSSLGFNATDGITGTNLLHNVFYFGQNDFAIGPELNITCSVSMGDVVELDDGRFIIVQLVGFVEITLKTYEQYKKVSRRDRLFTNLIMGVDRCLFIVIDDGVKNVKTEGEILEG
jgi:hypothetical protein